MKLLPLAALAALTAALAGPAAAAGLDNASFSTGDTTGWSTAGGGTVEVVSDAFDSTSLKEYTSSNFALLTAGSDDDYVTLSQAFTLSSSSTVSFYAAFLAFDETDGGDPYNDDAYVRIFSQTLNAIVFQSDVNTVGSYGSTDWLQYSSGLLGAGDYTIEAGVRNVGDDPDTYEAGFDSKLLLDNVSVTAAPVPEPTTWGLLIAGFAGVGGMLRRRGSRPNYI